MLIINNLNSTINFKGYINNLEPKEYVILSDSLFTNLISNEPKFKELVDKKYITCVTTNKINLSSNKTITTTNNTTNIDNSNVITTDEPVETTTEIEVKVEEKPKQKTSNKRGRKTRLVENR